MKPRTNTTIRPSYSISPAGRHLRRLLSVILLAGIGPLCTHAQTAEFTWRTETGNFCAPARVQFLPRFSEEPISYFWQFGTEGEESDLPTPFYTYNQPGTFKVVLVVLFNRRLVEVSRDVTIFGGPTLAMAASSSFLCKPGKVEFDVASTTMLSSIVWDFGDGSIGVSTTNSRVEHTFTSFGTFNVTANVVDMNGCAASATIPFAIQQPPAVLVDTPTAGCAPVTVDFSAAISVPDGSRVTKYTWDFGDGTSLQETATGNMKHTYTAPGEYFTKLQIVTHEGCTGSYVFDGVAFGKTPPRPVILPEKTTICASEALLVVAKAEGVDMFKWRIGVNEFVGPDTILQRFTTIGENTLTVFAIDNGCEGEADSVKIQVNGVAAGFTFTNDCADKKAFTFRNTSSGRFQESRWTFGDGLGTSAESRPMFVFPETGQFTTKLVVRDRISGCTDSAQQTIFTARPRLVASDSFTCTGNAATLAVQGSYANNRVQYRWTLAGRNGQTTGDTLFSLVAATPGIYSNQVIINNGTGYCRDTLVQENLQKVSGPVAGFSAMPAVCAGDRLTLTDSSRPANAAEPIVKWQWDLGNGEMLDGATPPPAVYTAAGLYTIRLTVTDHNGCSAFRESRVRVRRTPLLRIVPRSEKVCQGQDVPLTALHRVPVKWSAAGFISCDTCSAITVRPDRPTQYKAVATDSFGCSASDSITLDVWYPFTLPANVVRDTGVCAGGSVQYNIPIKDKIISWSPATGLSDTAVPNPLANPAATTRYTISVSDSGRCFTRSVTSLYEVYPTPVVDPGGDLLLEYNTPFTLSPRYSNNIAQYRWEPSSLLSCSNCARPSGRATESTTFRVQVVSDKGCTASGSLSLTIACNTNNLLMPTAFTPDNNGLNDRFYPITRGVSRIFRFAVYNRLGQLLFERKNFTPNDRQFGWDGLFQGKPQPSGGYVFFLDALCDQGGTISTKGSVVLIR